MIIDIPLQNPLSQTNKGDVSGTIHETFNVDLSIKPKKICLPNKMAISTSTQNLASLGLISKFVFFDGSYFAHSVGTDSGTYDNDGKVFKGGDGVDDVFTLPTWTGNTTDYNSTATIIEYGGDLLLISGDTWSISTSSDTSWSSETTTGGSNYSVVFEDRVYYEDGGRIQSFTDPTTHATSGTYTWLLPDSESESITGLGVSTAGIWIATSNDGGVETTVYLWDGQTENAYDNAYKVSDSTVMALKVHNDIPYIVTHAGIVMAFNGSYFEEVSRFPFSHILLEGSNQPDIDIYTSEVGRWIHQNGVDVIGGQLHFLVNPVAEDDSKRYGDYAKLAGVWCLDPEIGLYHRYAISVTADNGEVGQVKHVGALKSAAKDYSITASEFGSFLCSFSYYTENSNDTEEYAIGYVEPIAIDGAASTGHLTTQRIYSQSVQESWESLFMGFEELESTDSIELKYRTVEREGNNIAVTWSSTTQFTATDLNLANVKSKFDAGDSYECRVLLGNGSGIISQVSNITESGGTYTITLDTAHTGVSATNTGQVRLENWTSAGTITSSDNDIQFKEIPVARQSNWIQYKIILRGEEITKNKHNPVINRIVSVSNSHAKYQ